MQRKEEQTHKRINLYESKTALAEKIKERRYEESNERLKQQQLLEQWEHLLQEKNRKREEAIKRNIQQAKQQRIFSVHELVS